MLINLNDITKTIGTKTLYRGLDLTVQPGEKLGLIGRNGIGKTTLLGIMAGSDPQFEGSVQRRRGLKAVMTAQEHHGTGDQSALDYLLAGLPEYARLKHIIDTYPETMGDDMGLIEEYSSALERFLELDFYSAGERAEAVLESYGLPPGAAHRPLRLLSGGQKRFVELARVTLAEADLALIDEPTNHMDYAAKSVFIEWLKDAANAVVVVTHDRDVLEAVDRIVEVKDRDALSFPGNYDAYLKQNGAATAKAIDSYENAQKRLVKIEKQIRDARAKKAGWSGTADKTNPFMLLEKRLMKEREELLENMKRPDFWIDQETVSGMQDKVAEKYEKYKARNIKLRVGGAHRARQLLEVKEVSLGFDEPLFSPVSFSLDVGERLQLRGRNGAGKSTLIRQILAQYGGTKSASRSFRGEITLDTKLSIGIYEQEIEERYLKLPLGAAITQIYRERDLEINDQRVRQILADYLFDPSQDGRLEISRLSGGQKARFQLIAMLCHNPNLLILDEPTNHLDLPSIEELERALERYQGAVLYVSHDTYFARNLGGETISIERVGETAETGAAT